MPILDRQIPAERIDLLAAESDTPLAALKITNDGPTSLPAGVLTLYDLSGAAAFAGDARLGGLPAGESRLLSFAQDLRTTAKRSSEDSRTIAAITAAQGVVHARYLVRTALHVKLAAPLHETRTVMVEFAKAPGTTLSLHGGAMPSVTETEDAWRVPISLKPGETREVTAYRDRHETSERILLSGDALDPNVMVDLLDDLSLPEAARRALDRLGQLRRDESEKQAARDRIAADITAAAQDEDRIRSNLSSVAPPETFRAELTQQLRETEHRIAGLEQARAVAEAAIEKAHGALLQGVRDLNI